MSIVKPDLTTTFLQQPSVWAHICNFYNRRYCHDHLSTTTTSFGSQTQVCVYINGGSSFSHFKVEYPPGDSSPLKKFSNANLYMTLPNNLGTSDIKYFAVWSRQYEENFGHVEFHKHYSSATTAAGNAEKVLFLTILVLLSVRRF